MSGRLALDTDIARVLDAVINRHPAFRAHERFIRERLEQLAHYAYQHGRADALLSLRQASDVAEELGISRRTVWHHARRLGVGWKAGRELVFTPEDVNAIRERVGQTGRPRRQS